MTKPNGAMNGHGPIKPDDDKDKLPEVHITSLNDKDEKDELPITHYIKHGHEDHGHENGGFDPDECPDGLRSPALSRRGTWMKTRSRKNSMKSIKSRASSLLSLKSIKDMMTKETIMTIWIQSALPFLIAGLGSIGAGVALNQAQQFALFVNIPQMIGLSTPIMGLKGNLDMTFASRLATMSHQGKLDTWSGIKKRVPINMMLVQAQAIIISFFATAITLALSAIQNALHIQGAPSMDSLGSHIPLMIATGLLTICTSCGVMDTVMATMVIVSRRKNVNPDNITAPIAASMGDLACMCLLVAYGSVLYIPYNSNASWKMVPSIIVIIAIIGLWPFWLYKCLQDEKCRAMLKTSWFSLIASAVFSACGGFILQICINSFPEMSLYQPLMAGIAGNRVAVQSSRIASRLFTHHTSGELPKGNTLWKYTSVLRCYFSKDDDSGAARLLLATAVPFQAIFVSLTYLVSYLLHKAGVINPLPMINWQFTLGYLAAAFVQIFILLYCCQFLVFAMWRYKVDPDLHSIPILTGMGDLFGTTWAALAFIILYQITPSSIRTCWDADVKCS
ncbi:unnamed protein product, partial [Mesorhabditis belari]|uniref:SLC41A/MgtE integral membrane domain-containing protein n=1 Tax=Mesorhabditis belari TaxID=2138241 RepID=A0AAF3F2K6_9BILA